MEEERRVFYVGLTRARRRAVVSGAWFYGESEWANRGPSTFYNELAELMALAQNGKVALHTRTYPLDAAVEALQDLDAGRVRGRAILVP